MKALKKLCIALVLFGFNKSIAQEKTNIIYERLEKFPVFSIDYFNHANSDFEIESGSGEIKMNEFRTSLQFVPALKKGKTYLLNKIEYTLFNYEADFGLSNLNSEKNFHAIEYTFGVIHKLPKDWRVVVSVTPMLSSDFEESISSDDFLFQASALAIKRSSSNFEYGFGLAYTNKFGNPLLLPILRMTYKKNNWTTLVSLPSYVSQYYNFNEKTKVGVKATVFGNAFNATFDEGFSSSDINRVIYSRITVGPEFQTKLFKNLYLNASSGLSLRNVLEIQDSDLNTIGDFDIDNKFFFNIGLKILK
jgi:hypothetical protein